MMLRRGILLTYDAQAGAGKVSFFGHGTQKIQGFPDLERGDHLELTFNEEGTLTAVVRLPWVWPESNQTLTAAELDAVRCPEKLEAREAKRKLRLREAKAAAEKREKERAQKMALLHPATIGSVKRLETRVKELEEKLAVVEKRLRLVNAGWRFGDAGDLLGLSDEERAEVERRLAQTPK